MPKFLLFLIALFWTGVIIILCLIQSNELPVIQIDNLDKWVHSFFYFIFTLVWFLFFRKQFQSFSVLKLVIIAFSLSFFFGIGIEFMQQTFTTSRQGDIFDVIANSVGSFLAIMLIVIGGKLHLFDRILKN